MSEADAVIPLVRPHKYLANSAERQKVSFVYYPDPNDKDEKVKIYVPVYSGDENEDIEAFFETFTIFEQAMLKKKKWDNDFAHSVDCNVLFDYFDLCLTGTAQQDWHTVLETDKSRNWKSWKKLALEFIVEKILPLDAYEKQCRYLENRSMPLGMSFIDYYKRLQIGNNALPYMLTREQMEEISDGAVKTLKEHWVYGKFGPNKLKTIVLERVPPRWRDDFARSALNRSSTLERIVDYFQTADEREKHRQRLNKLGQERVSSRGGGRRQPSRQYGGQYTSNHQGTGYYSGHQGRLGKTDTYGNYYREPAGKDHRQARVAQSSRLQQEQQYQQQRMPSRQQYGQPTQNPYQGRARMGAPPTSRPTGRSYGREGGRGYGRPPWRRSEEAHHIHEQQEDPQEAYVMQEAEQQPYEEETAQYEEEAVYQVQHEQEEVYYEAEEAEDEVDELAAEWDDNLWLDYESDSAKRF